MVLWSFRLEPELNERESGHGGIDVVSISTLHRFVLWSFRGDIHLIAISDMAVCA